ncbi:MAG: nucleoside deaminase [Spirulinaceae cyanobacterium RM2_2_10]|nr:nucleoside deaminase [Spirulinaceae cyanobacterium SM2_1_0]NJO20420.1 nucleoside deaminase [Spirulinaceae cyanobacterium RM2_2_10]
MTAEDFMRLAIAAARDSQTPFGAVIVKDGEVVVSAGNTVRSDHDPTCHAEVNAIRRLMHRLGQPSVSGGYTLYSTCEPCAMCAATCFWAGIDHIVYGVGSNDFADQNPNRIAIRCEEVLRRSPNPCQISHGVLREECKQLHQDFLLD